MLSRCRGTTQDDDDWRTVDAVEQERQTLACISPLAALGTAELFDSDIRMCIYYAQLWYAIQHRTVLIIFPLILKTYTTARMLSVERQRTNKQRRSRHILLRETSNNIKKRRSFAHHLDNIDDCCVYPHASAESLLKILKVKSKEK